MSAPTSRRPRLLALTQCLPYPPHAGVTNRIFNILTGLATRFDVQLVPFFRQAHHPSQDAVDQARAALEGRLQSVASPVPIPAERSRTRRVLSHCGSLVRRRPYIWFEYWTPDFRRSLAAALEGGAPDLIHLESLDLYRWISELPPGPVAVTHHSIESDLLRVRAAVTPGLLAPAYLRYQANRVEEVERRWCPRVDLNLVVSTADDQRLRRVAPRATTYLAPNGVDLGYFQRRREPDPSPRVVFVGPSYVYQNREAIEWFLAASWPRILAAVPDATLELVGAGRPADLARFSAHRRVNCLGYLPDIRPVLEAATVAVVPIRIGGGTRLKILDAWGMATPVVSTTIGSEGLDAVDGEHLMVRDDASDIADAVVQLMRDPGLGRRLGAAGRRLAEARYSWSRIAADLADRYVELLRG